MATITKRATKGSPLTNDEVDANFENLNTDKLETSGGSVTGDISFGDNDKAIFGAGSDLQIYHDESNSYIEETGTGNLKILGDNIYLKNSADTETALRYIPSGELRLYYANDEKLATTNTGIDVTGTVTADGLTVDGDIKSQGTAASVLLKETDVTDENTRLRQSGGDFFIQTINDAENSAQARFRVDHATGDISFYEDTGTTAKFFWDASEERLGIGTTSPQRSITVFDAADSRMEIRTGTTTNLTAIDFSDSANTARGKVTYDHSDDSLSFDTLSEERMRIDSSGNVGIGTSSPGAKLEISDTDGEIRITGTRGTDTTHRLHTGGTNSQAFNITSGSTSGNAIYHNSTSHIFRSQTGATEYARIDSSGNVGIGTTSPNRPLQVAMDNAGATVFSVKNDGAVNAQIGFQGSGSANDANCRIGVASDTDFVVITGNSESLRVDDSGNVGIGTTSPDAPLHIESSTGNAKFLIEHTSPSTGTGQFSHFIDGDSNNTVVYDSNGYYRFGTSTNPITGAAFSEAMRIDSSGNLLVGKTSIGTANVGAEARANGLIQATRDGGNPLELNRKGSGGTEDGTIIDIRSNGATVGSIGTKNDDLYIGTGDTGIRFADSVNSVYPHNTATNEAIDATISLGANGFRFNTIHLSNGVSFDESPSLVTGSVTNKTLDDYEEGTWTTTFSSENNCSGLVLSRAKYIKVGNKVTLFGRVEGTITAINTETRWTMSVPILHYSADWSASGDIMAFVGTFTQDRVAHGALTNGSSNNAIVTVYFSGTSIVKSGSFAGADFTFTYESA